MGEMLASPYSSLIHSYDHKMVTAGFGAAGILSSIRKRRAQHLLQDSRSFLLSHAFDGIVDNRVLLAPFVHCRVLAGPQHLKDAEHNNRRSVRLCNPSLRVFARNAYQLLCAMTHAMTAEVQSAASCLYTYNGSCVPQDIFSTSLQNERLMARTYWN